MIRTALFFLLLFLTSASRATEEIAVQASQLQRLGVTATLPARARHTRSIEVSARIVVPPDQEHFVPALYGGVVTKVLAVPGQVVEAGAVIAQVASPEHLDLQRAFISAAIDHHLTETELSRDKSLFDDGAISRKRLEDTRAKAGKAAAQFKLHTQLLKMAGLEKVQIQALESTQQINHTLPVRSPEAGIVLESYARTGQRVEPAQALFRVGNRETLLVEAKLPVQHIDAVRQGDRVSLVELPEVAATISSLGGAVEEASQSVLLRAEIDSNAHRVRPGQAVRVTVFIGGGEQAWEVPVASVVNADDKGTVVFQRTGTGVAATPVKVLDRAGTKAIVSGPLNPERPLLDKGLAAIKALWLEQTEGAE